MIVNINDQIPRASPWDDKKTALYCLIPENAYLCNNLSIQHSKATL